MRHRRYQTHAHHGDCVPLAGLLNVAMCAVLADASSFTAIADWLHDRDEIARTRLGLPRGIPAITTLPRLLTRLDAAVLGAVLVIWRHTRTSLARSPRVTNPCDEYALDADAERLLVHASKRSPSAAGPIVVGAARGPCGW